MAQAWFGIYWTLPVNWAGFRNLPPDVDAAAEASRTIRYQRERVRQHVATTGGHLVGEVAFMDTRPDRATDAVRDVLRRAAPPRTATLLGVRFADMQWRNNLFLLQGAMEFSLDIVLLSPDPITIGGQTFDPIRHFAAWRAEDARTSTRLRLAAHEGLQAALAAVPPGDGRWDAVARRLNDKGIGTIRGGRWTAENVRKLAMRRGLAP